MSLMFISGREWTQCLMIVSTWHFGSLDQAQPVCQMSYHSKHPSQENWNSRPTSSTGNPASKRNERTGRRGRGGEQGQGGKEGVEAGRGSMKKHEEDKGG